MHTPDEALAELDYAVGSSACEAVMMEGCVRRPIAAAARDHPDAARWAVWIDNLGVDSPYDYDPVWQRCVELGVAPAFHAGQHGLGQPHVAEQLHVQPHRPLRRRRRGDLQGPVLRAA